VTWGPARLVCSSFAGDVGIRMRLAATILAPLMGQEPAEAVRAIIDLIDNPAPGRAAYRGPNPSRSSSATTTSKTPRLDDLVRADVSGA